MTLTRELKVAFSEYDHQKGVEQLFVLNSLSSRVVELRFSNALFHKLAEIENFLLALDPTTKVSEVAGGHLGHMYGADVSLYRSPEVTSKNLRQIPDNTYVVFYEQYAAPETQATNEHVAAV